MVEQQQQDSDALEFIEMFQSPGDLGKCEANCSHRCFRLP
jgi:hypothetical protein